jgi:hypothetical protein
MDRMHIIQQLLAIKDTVYGLLEWVENVSDEEFGRCCALQCGPPEEVLVRMEAFCQLSQELGGDCAALVRGLEQWCAGEGTMGRDA